MGSKKIVSLLIGACYWSDIWSNYFRSVIGNEETLESFELHICVKDYCFARDDRLVGVAVMQLKDIVEQVQ